MSIEGLAKFIYAYRLVLVMRIEVYQNWGIFMGIECASVTPHSDIIVGDEHLVIFEPPC